MFFKWVTDTHQLLVKTYIWAPLIGKKMCCSQIIPCCSIMKLNLLKLGFPEEVKCSWMDKTTIFWVSKFYYILMYIVQNKRGTYAPELIHGCVWQMQGLHMDFQIHIKACISSAWDSSWEWLFVELWPALAKKNKKKKKTTNRVCIPQRCCKSGFVKLPSCGCTSFFRHILALDYDSHG